MTARYPISTCRGGTDAPNHQQAHFPVKHLEIKGCVWRESTYVCLCVYRCFHTLTSQLAPRGEIFPEPNSSPSRPSPWLPGNLGRCQCPWARRAGDKEPTPHSTTKYGHRRTQVVKKVVEVWRKELPQECGTVKRGELLTKPLCPLSHLQQAVAHKRHQELVTVPLAHHGGVLRGVHAGEVEHGYVGLTVVVDGKVQCGQLVVGGEICSLAGIREQGSLVHIRPGQQQLRVCVVLQET